MSDTIIKMTGGVIRQQDNTILKNVNIEIRKGEFVYLIGKVGSGKSSFLKTLYAELPLTYGNAEVAGFRLKKIRKSQIPMLRRKCGIVFQDFKLLIDRNVYANLEFVLRATGWRSKKAIKERIETVLENVGMLDKQMQMPHQLSGGEQQRIVLARALLNAPPLILADEPTGNIDPETSYRLGELLKEISETGKTVIIATHQYDLIEKYPGRVLCCENGELTEKTPVTSCECANTPEAQATETVVETPAPVPANSEPEQATVPTETPQEIPSAPKEEIIPETQPETTEEPLRTPPIEELDEDIMALIGKLDNPEIFAFDYELDQLPEIDSKETDALQEETKPLPEPEATIKELPAETPPPVLANSAPEETIDPTETSQETPSAPQEEIIPETQPETTAEQDTTPVVEEQATEETTEQTDNEAQHTNIPENLPDFVQQTLPEEEKQHKNMPPAMDLELID
ncbi:MAG: ATP-binding cassette domain-containing protein [Odoribacter sp.]|nr:ATP-binding cassette domain-containing protein [Odoribacter sp.]